MATDAGQEKGEAMFDSLPNRPLTIDEADALAGDKIVPLSILMVGDGQSAGGSVYTLMVVSEGKDRTWVIGFSEEDGDWTIIHEAENDEWELEKQEARVQEWIEENYGDQVDSTGTIDTESGDIDGIDDLVDQ